MLRVTPHLRDSHVTAREVLVDVRRHQHGDAADLKGRDENNRKDKLLADLFLHHGGVYLAHVAVLVTNPDISGQSWLVFVFCL